MFPTRTIFCKDNLDVMRGINSNCIDLIYLDPLSTRTRYSPHPLEARLRKLDLEIFPEKKI